MKLCFALLFLLCSQLSWSLQVDWLQAIGKVAKYLHFLETSSTINSLRGIDITGEAGLVSERPRVARKLLAETDRNNSALSPLQFSSLYEPDKGIQRAGFFRIHQMSRSVIRTVPDIILLGALALISTELVQREVVKQSNSLPPILRTLANQTLSELDNKLEVLSALEYNFAPFFQLEYSNLQTQPLQLLDKYVVSEMFVRIDRDLTPLLASILADEKQAKQVSKRLKDLVSVLVLALTSNSNTNNNLNLLNTILDNNGSANSSTPKKLSFEYFFGDFLMMNGTAVQWDRMVEEVSRALKTENLLTFFVEGKGSEGNKPMEHRNSTGLHSIDTSLVLFNKELSPPAFPSSGWPRGGGGVVREKSRGWGWLRMLSRSREKV